MFFWNSLAFPMIQRMLAIWSLVPLPFLKRKYHLNLRHVFHLAGPVAVIFIFDHFLLKYFSECHCLMRRKAEEKVWDTSDGAQESSKFRAGRLGRAQVFCPWAMSLLLLIHCYRVSLKVAGISVCLVSFFISHFRLGNSLLFLKYNV